MATGEEGRRPVIEGLAVESGDHMVHFYDRESGLVEVVGHHLLTGLENGSALVVIATEPHRLAFEAELHTHGVDLADVRRHNRLILLDAAHTLSEIMVDGRIDPDAFRVVIGGVIGRAIRASGERSGVRAYGEMVGLLWEAGDVLNVIELESLWNEVSNELPLSLLCAYRTDAFSTIDQPGGREAVCRLHSSVLGVPAGSSGSSDQTDGTEITVLLEATRTSPGAARHLVIEVLRSWNCNEVLIDDAALVVTELASNVVVHVAKPFSLRVTQRDSSIRIAVDDSDPKAPMMNGDRLMSRSGRGLGMIASVATRSGVIAGVNGKTVWVELRKT
jgi:anti-sigma regulatory factor (Ser/Thr protein kinase)